MIIAGIDLSLTGTGIAEIEADDGGLRRVRTHTIRSKAENTTMKARLDRLHYIRDEITRFLQPGELAVLEGPSLMSMTGQRHERSGLWWMVAQELLFRGYAVVEVAPTVRAKYACGRGNGSKRDVLDAVRGEWSQVEVANDNEADALTLAAIGFRCMGFPVDGDAGYRVDAAAKVYAALQDELAR